MAAATLRATDWRLIEDLFEMGSGYVLDFSNRTFAEFFEDELGINIYDDRWEQSGTSKANRLRLFLRSSPEFIVRDILKSQWDYREANRRRTGIEESIPEAEDLFYELIERLGGKRPQAKQTAIHQSDSLALDPVVSSELQRQLLALSTLDPQPRGYAFERFLKAMFDANGLGGRASFRLVGEQIDGSFELASETYLLEAKWTALPVGASDLRSFNGKVQDKATWSRGLFVSESGFTDEGLTAFGRANSVVCMEGLDLYEMLKRNLSLSHILGQKVRRAAESGRAFVPFRDLRV